jgi:hypothetical protein
MCNMLRIMVINLSEYSHIIACTAKIEKEN